MSTESKPTYTMASECLGVAPYEDGRTQLRIGYERGNQSFLYLTPEQTRTLIAALQEIEKGSQG